MNAKRRISLLIAMLAVGVLFGAGTMTAFGAVTVGETEQTATCGQAGQPPVTGRSDALNGVTVISRCDAWAVGWWSANNVDRHAWILRWNGRTWQQVSGANTGGADSVLNGVAAVSANDIWAVGYASAASRQTTLIEHWNGSAWSRVPSPNPGLSPVYDQLAAVAALSARDAWAVGDSDAGTFTLVEHWNGSTWKQVRSPNPGPVWEDAQFNSLSGVAALSATNAWAVGNYQIGTPCCFVSRTLILHWNGHRWKKVYSVNPGGRMTGSALVGVAARSPEDAWAVGGAGSGSLIEHWDGTSWRLVASPRAGSSSSLVAVVARTLSSSWAVGSWVGRRGRRTLMVHWNGRKWSLAASPNPGLRRYGKELVAIAGKSCTSIWAVGDYSGTSSRGAQVSRAITARC